MDLYKKIRNILLLVVLFSVYCNFLYGQKDTPIKYEFSFYKFNNPKKVKKLHSGDEIKIILYPTSFLNDKQLIQDSYGDYVKPDSGSLDITYSGILNAHSDSNLSIMLTGKNIETAEYYADTDSQYKYNKIYYKKGDWKNDGRRDSSNIWEKDTVITLSNTCPVYYNTIRTSSTDITYSEDSILNINLQKIDYVTYSKPGNFTDNNLNVSLLCLSLVSGLVAAPAASIDYSRGGFNTHRYYNILIPSLAFFSCDLTLYLILNRERKYKVRVALR